MYRLLFQGRLATRPALAVREPRLWLGRDETCQVQLPENGVSPRHAVIERRDDGYYITDLNSEVGLRVNGQPVTQHRLQAGDQIEIGSVTLRFEIAYESVPTARRPDWLLTLTAVVVVLLVFGQIAILAWIFSQPRPTGTMRPPLVPEPAEEPARPPAAAPTPAPVPPPPAPAPARPVVLNRQLRIERVTETGDAALQIQVRAQVGERELDPQRAVVEVIFFLRADDGTVLPLQPPVPLNTAGMKNFASKTLAAAFPGPASKYAGYIVRTYYRGELQDEAAKSADLLRLAPATPQ